jgi:hypothetical protein
VELQVDTYVLEEHTVSTFRTEALIGIYVQTHVPFQPRRPTSTTLLKVTVLLAENLVLNEDAKK